MLYYVILFYVFTIPIASYLLLKYDDDDVNGNKYELLFEAIEDFYDQIGPGIELEQEDVYCN